MLRQIVKISFLFASLLAMVISITAQTAPSADAAEKVVSNEPWLVTVIHQVNVVELQRSLAQQGINIKMRFNGQEANINPVNITTGIVIDREGHILTRLVNINPEANPADNGTVMVALATGEQRKARLIGLDGPSGFCLLAVDNLNVEPARLAEQSTIEIGTDVTLVNMQFKLNTATPAVPNNLVSPNSSKGVWGVSYKLLRQPGKIVRLARRALFSVQFSSLLERNNFSNFGAVLNNKKEVVGIPEGGQVNAVQAFSSVEARRAADRIIARNGNVPRAWLGVEGRNFTPVVANPTNGKNLPKFKGVLVFNVAPGSPAEQAGLLNGDVIISVNGEEVDTADSLSSFISLQPAKQVVQFNIQRGEKTEKVSVTLGERGYPTPYSPDKVEQEAHRYFLQRNLQTIEKSLTAVQHELQTLQAKQPDEKDSERIVALNNEANLLSKRQIQILEQIRAHNIPTTFIKQDIEKNWIGIVVEDVYVPTDEDNRPENIAKPKPRGVRITSVLPNSIAARAGLQVNDVILQFQSYVIDNHKNLVNALSLLRSTSISDFEVIVTRGSDENPLKINLRNITPRTNTNRNQVVR